MSQPNRGGSSRPCVRVSMMKCVVLAGSAVRMATSGVETQRAAWNADVNSSIERIMYVLLLLHSSRRVIIRKDRYGTTVNIALFFLRGTMSLQYCYNASEDTFPLPQGIKDRYGPFGFSVPRDPQRPYISSNFVMGLDGRVSFRELKGRTGGSLVSRSREDRWLMDFQRAHHDAVIMGANTLRE